MKYLNYFVKQRFAITYPIAAICLSLIVSFFIRQDFFLSGILVLPLVCILIFMRTYDDVCDFEKDRGRKKQYLGKSGLIFLSILSGGAFIISNAMIFGLTGVLSIFFILYILTWQKLPLMKLFFAVLLYFYYYKSGDGNNAVLLGGGGTLFILLPLVYYYLKRKLKK